MACLDVEYPGLTTAAKREEKSSDHALEEALGDYLVDAGWPPATVTRLLSFGESVSTYGVSHAGQQWILRLSRSGTGNRQLGTEFAALQAVAASGCAPLPLLLDPAPRALPGAVLVMQHLPGRPLAYSTDLERAGTALGRIHAQTPHGISEELRRLPTPLHALAQESLQLLERCPPHHLEHMRSLLMQHHEALLRRADELDPLLALDAPVVAHTRPYSSSFLVQESHARLMRWSHCVAGSRYLDLGHFCAPTTTLWQTNSVLLRHDRLRFLAAYREELERQQAPDIPSLGQLEVRTIAVEQAAALRAVAWCFMTMDEYANGKRMGAQRGELQRINIFLDTARYFLG